MGTTSSFIGSSFDFLGHIHSAASSASRNGAVKKTAGRHTRTRCRYAQAPCPPRGNPAMRGASQRVKMKMGQQGENGGSTAPQWDKLMLDRPMERVRIPEGRGLRLHCVSDLHTDIQANMDWLKTWPSWKGDETEIGRGHEDVLLVSGDLSSSLTRVMETLSNLLDRYDQVFIVAGNHDLWIPAMPRHPDGKDGAEGTGGGSIAKLQQFHHECERLGARVNPVTFVLGESVEGSHSDKMEGKIDEVSVVPLLSWYHASWDDEPDFPPDQQIYNGTYLRQWADYRNCRWPTEVCSHENFVTVSRDSPTPLADFFARQNEDCIKAFLTSKTREGSVASSSAVLSSPDIELGLREGGESTHASAAAPANTAMCTTVVSFSHFVPRQELFPEKKFLSEPMLTKTIGSNPLERQIRQLGSDVHVFGHTHIPYDMDIDGVRYLQWPLGTVSEQSRQCHEVREKGPLLLYSHDGRHGGFSPQQPTFWGNYYREHARDPTETQWPEWALDTTLEPPEAESPHEDESAMEGT